MQEAEDSQEIEEIKKCRKMLPPRKKVYKLDCLSGYFCHNMSGLWETLCGDVLQPNFSAWKCKVIDKHQHHGMYELMVQLANACHVISYFTRWPAAILNICLNIDSFDPKPYLSYR